GEKEGDRSEAKSSRNGSGGVDTLLWDRTIDQSGESEDECNGSGDGEGSVARGLGFEHDEWEGGDQQGDRGGVNGEKVESEESKQDEERAEGAGDDGPGHIELKIDEKRSEDKDQDRKIGIGEAAEEALAKGGFEDSDWSTA